MPDNPFDSPDPSLYDIHTRAPGPQGSLPLTPEMLLTRPSDVGPMNALYASAFGPPPYPARTTCVVQALPNPAMLIEIECVASLAGH